MENIELLRDLVISISGIVAILVFIFIALLVYMVYRRTSSLVDSMQHFYKRSSSVMDSMESTTNTVCGIISDVRNEVVSPLTQIAGIVQGVRYGIDLVNRFTKKKEQGGEIDE
jgi:hypothetical protein